MLQLSFGPAIVKKDNHYFLFFAANDIQSDDQEGGIGIGISSRPEGPYKDYLGKPLLDKFYHGAQPIDQFVFHDKDGRYYLIYGGWGHCNIARLKDDFTGFLPFKDGVVFKEITPEGYVEGPDMFIRHGKYYFMWSEGGWGGPNYRVAYAMADTPLGPFKRIGVILKQDPNVANGSTRPIPAKPRGFLPGLVDITWVKCYYKPTATMQKGEFFVEIQPGERFFKLLSVSLFFEVSETAEL